MSVSPCLTQSGMGLADEAGEVCLRSADGIKVHLPITSVASTSH